MNAGVLGVPGDGRLNEVSDRVSTHHERGQELTTAVDVREQHTLEGETACVEGRVLYEEVETCDVVTVDDGTIKVGDRREKVQQWAEIAGMTAQDGHEGFLVVDSSSAIFAFDVAGDAIVEPAEIQLSDFVDYHDVYQVGTAGSPALGPVDSVTAHGSNVLEDDDIGVGDHIKDSIRAGTLSQVRIRYDSPGWGPVRGYLAASGYVEVYDPELDTPEFLTLVANDILPFTQGGDGA